jgi:hypothetical protein
MPELHTHDTDCRMSLSAYWAIRVSFVLDSVLHPLFLDVLLIEPHYLAGFVSSFWPPLAAPLSGIAGATAATAPISVAISVLGLVVGKSRATGAACRAPTIGVAAAPLLIADVATAAVPAAAAAFTARGPIGVFAASSARVFPALSSTALPPTSVTVVAASSTAALTVYVVAAPPAVAASRWVTVLVAESVSLGPEGLRLLAPLHARSSAVSASTAAWSPWAVRRLPSAVGSWMRKTLLIWASAEPGLGRSSGTCRLGGVPPGSSGRLVALLREFGPASRLARSASSSSVPSASPRACCVGGSGSAL